MDHERVFWESTDKTYLLRKKWLAPVPEGSIVKETPKQTGKAMGMGGQKQLDYTKLGFPVRSWYMLS